MDISSETRWFALVSGGGPLLVLVLLKWWNEILYIGPLKLRNGGYVKLPPGNMGLLYFGEMLSFLWYFKILRRPDDFIEAKRQRYGEGVGVYRTCLFGTPSIISCSPASNKFFLQRDDIFPINWPSTELVGESSVAVVNGKAHTRLRSYVFNAINSPDALKRIVLVVQPRISSSLQLWADKGTLNGMKETKKVTFANIGKMLIVRVS